VNIVFLQRSPRSQRHRTGRRSGQALVEFALVIPLFLLLLAGMVDFGLGLNASITVTNAAREGARLGTINPNAVSIQARALSMTSGLDQTKVSVTSVCKRPTGSTPSTCTFTTWQVGDSVRVTVDYDYSMLWPLAFGNTIHLSSTTEMRLE
jgi:Flp pilus assembly protein TadG